ncbi:MAG: SCO family protein [Verrucomicrobiota bacterium]
MNCIAIRFIVLSSSVSALTLAPSAEPTQATDQVHTTRGIVREIAGDRHTAVIRHEAIQGYMPAMTMEFNVKNTNELSGIAVGDSVTFRLSATKQTHWIDTIRKVASATNSPPPAQRRISPSLVAELKPGDLLPDSDLLAENGKSIRFSDYRGKAVAFTFIFTRCPLPDYCPRMGSHFAEARELLLGNTNAPANWQFLSISFDPEFDTPAVLSNYAKLYRKNTPDRWLFATASRGALEQLAPRLDLMVRRESGGSISHNLRTVVLDPVGRIHRQFDGNQWTPKELTEAVVQAAGKTNP